VAPSRFPKLTRANLSQEVYEILKERIFSREFAPGSRLQLDKIERQMDISRTPLKVALERLAAEGLVKIIPRRGTYVTQPSPEDIEQAFDVRGVLEVYAVETAAERVRESHLAQVRRIVEEMQQFVDRGEQAGDYLGYAELNRRFHAWLVDATGNRVLAKLWEQANAQVQIARIRYQRGDKNLALRTEEHMAILEGLERRDGSLLKELMTTHIERAKSSLRKDLQAFIEDTEREERSG
jgi:DNA-binding GntR family transcriptional regulator